MSITKHGPECPCCLCVETIGLMDELGKMLENGKSYIERARFRDMLHDTECPCRSCEWARQCIGEESEEKKSRAREFYTGLNILRDRIAGNINKIISS